MAASKLIKLLAAFSFVSSVVAAPPAEVSTVTTTATFTPVVTVFAKAPAGGCAPECQGKYDKCLADKPGELFVCHHHLCQTYRVIVSLLLHME